MIVEEGAIGPWVEGPVRCLNCKHEWSAKRPEAAWALLCPACRLYTAVKPVEPDPVEGLLAVRRQQEAQQRVCELARHELTTLHGLRVYDGLGGWTIDVSRVLAALDSVLPPVVRPPV